MKEDSLKLAQLDVEEALHTIETMENELNNQTLSKETLKDNFVFLFQKVQELESILKEEGIID